MRILIPVDGSEGCRRAIRFLAHRAAGFGTRPEVEFVNVQNSVPESLISMLGRGAVKQYYLDTGKTVFDKLDCDEEKKALNAAERVLYAGDIDRALAEEAESFRADLIILSSRGLDPMRGLLLGSVSNGLLASTHVPMLILRGEPKLIDGKMRIGICVDGSDYGEAAANFALSQIEFFGPECEFTLIHCAVPGPRPIAHPMMPVITPEELIEARKEKFEAEMNKLAEPLEIAGRTVKRAFLVGDPDVELPRFAEENLDLVIMGSHGRGNFTAAVLGSTAMHVAAASSVPLLVIRKPE